MEAVGQWHRHSRESVVLWLQDLEIDLLNVTLQQHWVVKSLSALLVLDVRGDDYQLLHCLIVVNLPVESNDLLLIVSSLIEALLMGLALGHLEQDRLESSDSRVLVFSINASLGQRFLLLNANVHALNLLLQVL